ncbi:hypothetical protein [Bacillus sp. B1-b2]|uniref:hypothetical protein n=1 Tax=Bacillus sp. B1-b2 TaxID=2653201 RepID=UPI001261445B|nr:hypothetical protein [Bacillus sp. B1-b2]KAB7670032.1 hypothetical protein F9279_09865 [Bacillus sp. B1-b2]
MQKWFSIILIGLGGYYLIQKRYKFLNSILRSPYIRKYAIRIIMSIPAIRKTMMNNVFGKSKDTIYQ